MNKWDIYFADVPFEGLSKSKPRPVIILDDSVAVVDCLKLTGQAARPGEYVLQKWKEAGLRKPTTVRLSKRLALDKAVFQFRVGTLQPIDILEIQKLLSL